MKESAVIDRFEGELAVLLVGEGERRVSFFRSELPPGVNEGDWLQIELEGDRLVGTTVDEATSARMRQRIAEKLARLRRGEHK
jgi:hypothetical protein